jgi:hypothetical protein
MSWWSEHNWSFKGMKKKICVSLIMLITVGPYLSPKAHASIFTVQPRLETGLMYYSVERAAISETTLPNAGETTGYNSGHEKNEFSDNMGFIGGGATFFRNRLFADLSAQYAFDGSSRAQDSKFEYSEATNSFTDATGEYQGQFDRWDRAVSVGYALTRRFSIYAGYKWASTDMDAAIAGQASILDIDNYVLNGHFSGEEDYQFEYEGPFVGLANGWEIGHGCFFDGLISAKLALAYLNSKLRLDQTGTLVIESINGSPIDPVIGPLDQQQTIKGTTWGLAFGLDWRGATQIGNLAYCIGISGYRYNFNSDDSLFSDISETSVIFKVGLSYVY